MKASAIIPCQNCGGYFATTLGECPNCDVSPEAPIITVREAAKKAPKNKPERAKEAISLASGTISTKHYKHRENGKLVLGQTNYILSLPHGGELEASKRSTLEAIKERRNRRV